MNENKTYLELDLNWYESFEKHELNRFAPVIQKYQDAFPEVNLLDPLQELMTRIINHFDKSGRSIVPESVFEEFSKMKLEFYHVLLDSIFFGDNNPHEIAAMEFRATLDQIVLMVLQEASVRKRALLCFPYTSHDARKGKIKRVRMLENQDFDDFCRYFIGWLVLKLKGNQNYFDRSRASATLYNSITGGEDRWGWVKTAVGDYLKELTSKIEADTLDDDNSNNNLPNGGGKSDRMQAEAATLIEDNLSDNDLKSVYYYAILHSWVTIQKTILRDSDRDMFVCFIAEWTKDASLMLNLRNKFSAQQINKMNFEWKKNMCAVTYWICVYMGDHDFEWLKDGVQDETSLVNSDQLLLKIIKLLNVVTWQESERQLSDDLQIAPRYLDTFLQRISHRDSINIVLPGFRDKPQNPNADGKEPKLMKKLLAQTLSRHPIDAYTLLSKELSEQQAVCYENNIWIDFEHEVRNILEK